MVTFATHAILLLLLSLTSTVIVETAVVTDVTIDVATDVADVTSLLLWSLTPLPLMSPLLLWLLIPPTPCYHCCGHCVPPFLLPLGVVTDVTIVVVTHIS